VLMTFRLPCGSDDALHVLEERGARLVPAMKVEANGYASIGDGQLAMSFGISPPDEHGRWYAVTAHSHPWCTSTWRGIRYRAFEPTGSAPAPRVLLDRSSSAQLGGGSAGELSVEKDAFTVRFTSWEHFGPDVSRPYVRRYQRGKTGFSRTLPFVERIRDVPEEWALSSWSDARTLMTLPPTPALEALHRALAGDADKVHGAIVSERSSGDRTFLRYSCRECSPKRRDVDFEIVSSPEGARLAGVTEAP
jgi:hypothetical protein